MTHKITAIEHKDVFEKSQFYIKLEVENKAPVHINVGKGTYDKVKTLTDGKEGSTADQPQRKMENKGKTR